jgi:lipoprotein NlpI
MTPGGGIAMMYATLLQGAARALALALMLVAVAAIIPAPAQTSLGSEWCRDDRGDVSPDQRIAACTALIARNPNDASAFFNRGNAYQAINDPDRALADLTQAIALDPKNATALVSRCSIYNEKNERDRAIADCSDALRLDQNSALAYNNRGTAYGARGNFVQAIADYTETIRIDPNASNAYFNRGRAHFYSGALPAALADLNRASELNPKYAYVPLWLDIVNRRSNLPSRLTEASRQVEMTEWPAPVLRLYLGQSTQEAVLAAAEDRDARRRSDQLCEANFYIAEWLLQRDDKDKATRLFRLAAAGCPKSFTEYEGAMAELKALGATP